MWMWTLNWNEIRDSLVIGSCPMIPSDLDRIHREAGASAVQSLQSDVCRSALRIDYGRHCRHGEECGLVMVNTPMRDFDVADQRRNLPQAVSRLAGLIEAGHKVYLHCTAGINRAPLTALAYLTFVEMMPPDVALAQIRNRRSDVDPSWEAYNGCRQDLVSRLRPEIETCAYQLWQQGRSDDPHTNWYDAERLLIRRTLVGG